MKRGDYIACVPATVFTLWLFFPNALGPFAYFVVLLIGFCGIAVAYCLFALAYGAVSGYTLPNYNPRRYVIFALVNALPYFLALAFRLPRGW